MSNAVSHPSHYRSDSGIEVIDAIEAWNLNFSRGNAVKYVARAGMKDIKKEIEDLEKAKWYIDREISLLKAEGPAENTKSKLSGCMPAEVVWPTFEEINKLYMPDEGERIWENGVEIK